MPVVQQKEAGVSRLPFIPLRDTPAKYSTPDAVGHQEMLLPVGTGQHRRRDADLARAGGCVDHLAVAEIDSDMADRHRRAGEHHDVAALEVAPRRDALVLRAGAPAAASHIALLHAGLVQTPVDEPGAVKLVRALCAGNVRAAELALRNCDEVLDLRRGGIGRLRRCSRLSGLFRSLGRRFRRGLGRCGYDPYRKQP